MSQNSVADWPRKPCLLISAEGLRGAPVFSGPLELGPAVQGAVAAPTEVGRG